MVKATSPNLIIIVLDSLRQDFLSCYGYPKLTTPNLDRLGSRGWIFKNAITTAINTTSAHASLFTGMYYRDHQLHNLSGTRLSPDLPTLAEILQKHGYITIGISNNPFIGNFTGLNRGFRYFFESKLFYPELPKSLPLRVINKILRVIHQEKLQFGIRYSAELMVNKAQDILQGIINEDSPFFLFINLMETHIPHSPPLSPWQRLTNKGFCKLQKKWKEKKLLDYIAGHISGVKKIPEEELNLWKELYALEINYADGQIGRLIRFLEKEGIVNDTLIIITSDHGDSYGEHGLFSHAFGLYDNLIKVPLIFLLPGIFEGGKEIDTLVQINHIFPTIMKLAKIPEEKYPHITCKPLLGINQRDFNFAFSETPDNSSCTLMKKILELNPKFPARFYGGPKVSIRTKEFKYISHIEGGDEFYNLIDDPKEEKNLIKESIPEKEKLQNTLSKWRKERKLQIEEEDKSSRESEHKIQKELRVLGYL